MEIKDTLSERGGRYGTFAANAEISQALKGVMQAAPNWKYLRADQAEALDMIAAKISRILSGDANYHDSWHDIEGYARLVSETLKPGS